MKFGLPMAALWVHIEKSYKNQQMCDIAKKWPIQSSPSKNQVKNPDMTFRKEEIPILLLEL
jgi:hypothetical protein